MPYKVLVVEDSSFFRRRLTDILNADPNLTVIDVAVNGIEAVEKAALLKPDVITMDIEMPRLNGIEAVKQIMQKSPTPILMFSSLTHEGAKSTLDALDAGALDFLPKKFTEIANDTSDAGNILRQRVVGLAQKKLTKSYNNQSASVKHNTHSTRQTFNNQAVTSAKATDATTKDTRQGVVSQDAFSQSNVASQPAADANRTSNKKYKVLVIGTSTGGPVALQKILTQLPKNFPLPILMVQHMPATFTKAFANRLNSLCQLTIKEAENKDELLPGVAYLAPGGKQMILDPTSPTSLKIIDDNSNRVSFKPSVDVTFGSTAKVFKGDTLAIILTGMGSDGKEGCRLLKSMGATIWSQNEESCVVYGMPQAVHKAGLSSKVLSVEKVASAILQELNI